MKINNKKSVISPKPEQPELTCSSGFFDHASTLNAVFMRNCKHLTKPAEPELANIEGICE